jgi:hypothetical protein
VKHDADEGLRFLRWMYPEGPWALCAIPVAQNETRTRTFRPSSEREYREWLVEYKDWNVYYHVNKPIHDIRSKAERKEIDLVCFLHVDVDYRVGEPFEDEQKRIEELFKSKLPPGVPRPSALVKSGGGCNGLWRLKEPLVVAGVEAVAEEHKRYNLQLEILLGGDNCHDVTRILRLPGTVNWPTEKKRKKGRVPTMATLLWMEDFVYPISNFVAAPLVQTKGGDGGLAAGGGVPVKISGNVQRFNHIDELGDKIPQRTKVLIVNGHDPDEPNKWPSRSELLFHVCCELVRSGCTDDQIYSVVTDPGFKISASVLDKGGGVERYAMRQIQRARENAVDPQLAHLNEKHAVIGNMGGKCRVIEMVADNTLGKQRMYLTTQSFEDFRNRYMNIRVKAGENKDGEAKHMALGNWWLQHPNRRQYENIVFAPGREVQNSYNLWTGFSYEARPGNRHDSLLAHIKTNVCGNVKEYYEYLLKWMARGVQHPDSPGEVAVVFRGDQGTGKGTVAREYGSLWGRHYIQIFDPKHLVGNFNAHLRDAVVVFADEAFYAGDKKHESILKGLITEELLMVEGKGKDVEKSMNYVHLMMASNSQWVVPAGPNERRYLVLDVRDTGQMQSTKYFGKMKQDMEGNDNEGRKNFLHMLLTMDLSDFDVRAVPKTEALRDQKLMSMDPEHEWFYQKLQNGQLVRDHLSWDAPVFKEDLLDDYLRYTQKIGIQRRASATALGRFLYQILPAGWPRSRQHTRVYHNPEGVRMQERSYAYWFPSLKECRDFWDKHMSGPYVWPEADNVGSEQVDAF